MVSSFQRGRPAAATTAGQARPSKTTVQSETPGTPANPEFEVLEVAEKDATKPSPRALGAALRIYRGERSRENVATAAGVQRGKLSAYEQGRTRPRPATLARLAETLEVAVPVIEVLATLLDLAPELLERTADPADLSALARAGRQTAHLRQVEAALLPGELHPLAVPEIDANRQAAALWARLQPYSAVERRAIVRDNEEFQVWPLSRRLCDESIEAAAVDPAEALELARLAERLALLVAGSDAWRSRLQGFCGFHVSSALRVGGSLSSAGEALQRAKAFWEAGARDPANRLGEARVLGLEASQLREQRHLEEALHLLDQALADPGDLRAHLMINRAKILEEQGKFEGAIATLHRALPYIDTEREPRLLWSQRFNLAVNLQKTERYADAERLMEEIWRLAPKGVSRTRVAWLEGLIAAGLGRREDAENLLKGVREDFLARQNAYDAALASLDLAALYLRQNRTAEVKSLAAEMVKTFREQKVHREALAAVRLFRLAATREQASVELACYLADYLRRARNDAAVRFGG